MSFASFRKALVIGFLTLVSFDAGAQFFSGLSFDIKWTNNGTTSNSGAKTKTDNTYSGTISPQFGYQFNPNLQVGTRLNFTFDKSYTTEAAKKEGETATNYVTASVGWDIAPFGRYRIAKFGKNDWFSIWADVHAYFGRMYPRTVQEEGYIPLEFDKKYIYGIQAMPALGFRINEKSTLFINVAILSLAYSGTYTEYKDKAYYTNNAVFFTGKISGLATTIASEGMYSFKFGMIRMF